MVLHPGTRGGARGGGPDPGLSGALGNNRSALLADALAATAGSVAKGLRDGASSSGPTQASSGQPPQAAGVTSLRRSGTQYTKLVAEALTITQLPSRTQATLQKAERNLREAILLCPERRDAHGVLAQLVVVRDSCEAAGHFLRTVELSIGHDELWAKSIVCVFEHFQGREAHGMVDSSSTPLHLPAWWNDDRLKAAAVEAKALLPSFEWRATRMHAIVLSSPLYPWRAWGDAGERTPTELRAAADSYQSLVRTIGGARKGLFPAPQGMSPEDTSLLRIGDPDVKTYITLALECRKRASSLEAIAADPDAAEAETEAEAQAQAKGNGALAAAAPKLAAAGPRLSPSPLAAAAAALTLGKKASAGESRGVELGGANRPPTGEIDSRKVICNYCKGVTTRDAIDAHLRACPQRRAAYEAAAAASEPFP